MIEFDLTGMTCANCVRHVEHALSAVPGVAAATVNLVSRRATVDAAPELAPQLIAAVEQAGYGAALAPAVPSTAADTETAELRRALGWALLPTIPLLLIAMAPSLLPGTDGVVGAWVQFALATPVVFGPGFRFLHLAAKAARQRTSDMNTLVAIGILAAWGASTAALLTWSPHAEHGGHPGLYFEAAAVIICFLLLGRLLEARARYRLGDAVRGLVALHPPVAHRLLAGVITDVAVSSLATGDVVVVRPGERIPADGTVRSGVSSVDAALVSGESMPLTVRIGDGVHAGCLNLNGALELDVTQVGVDSLLGQIVAAVTAAQGSRAPIARLADRVSAILVPVILGIAAVTFIAWALIDPTTAGLSQAVIHAVTVLVIACPCALGLATPAAVAVGTGRGAQLGVLIKGGAALETASRIDTVLLDKTGTLTAGKPVVGEIATLPGITRDVLLSAAAAAERVSEHPVARAIVEAGVAFQSPAASEAVATPGGGIRAAVAGEIILVGSSAYLAAAGVAVAALEPLAARMATAGATPVLVAINGLPAGVIAVADQLDAGAATALAGLRELKIRVIMLSGDRQAVADAVAAQLGITEVIAGATPLTKADTVRALIAEGRHVAMVGDGLNDAPALAGAHLGVAVGSGTAIAQAAAQVVLLRGGIATLPTALSLARLTMATIRQNLFWAFAYNVVAIPLAAGVLVPLTGWSLSPMIASAAMALSSVSVVLNSLRLRWVLRRAEIRR